MKSSSVNKVAIGVLIFCAGAIALWFYRFPPQTTQVVVQWREPLVATIDTTGKTKVLKHDGTKFQRLYEFCTWTLDFHCHFMKTPVGRIPFYMHKPGTDAWMSDVIAKDQDRDPGDIALISRQLKKLKNPMFVDIGSNLGVYTMVIAKTLKIRVLAIDPLVENVVRLCKTIQENKLTENITIIFNALSNKYEKVGFFKPFHHIEATKVIKLNETYIGGPHSCAKPTSGLTCQLDDLLPLMTSKSAVLKLDVEAHEYKILYGGQKFLDTIDVPAIYMEWINVKGTEDGKPLVEFLRKRNYIAYSTGNQNTPLDWNNHLKWPFNIIWIRKGF